MRITAVTELYPADFKGYFDAQFADLVEKGHVLTILAAGSAQRTANETIRAYRLDRRTRYYPPTSRYLYRGLTPGTATRVPRIWRRISPLGTVADPLGTSVRLAMAARSAPDAILIHGLTAGKQFGGLRRVFPDTPVACYYHGGELPGMPPVSREAAAGIFTAADVVFSNTMFSAKHAIDRGCPADRVRILPMGLDLDRYPDSEPEPLAGRPPRFLSASRMSEEKGLIHALEALATLDKLGLRSWHYTLTGDGPDRAMLERFTRKWGLADRVKFLGTVPDVDMVDEMRKADFFLLPSLHLGNWAENQAVVVQEAMLMNAVPITTDTGGLPESVPEEIRRLQVPAAEPKVLAERLATVIGFDGTMLNGLRSAGRRFVKYRYDVRVLNDRLLQILRETQMKRR